MKPKPRGTFLRDIVYRDGCPGWFQTMSEKTPFPTTTVYFVELYEVYVATWDQVTILEGGRGMSAAKRSAAFKRFCKERGL